MVKIALGRICFYDANINNDYTDRPSGAFTYQKKQGLNCRSEKANMSVLYLTILFGTTAYNPKNVPDNTLSTENRCN